MRIQKAILATLALSLISSCAGSTMAPPTNSMLRANQVSALSNRNARVETLVDRSRMEANLAALTGKAPAGPNMVIPERGSKQNRELTRVFLTNYLTQLGYKVERHEYRPNGANILTRLMADVPTDEYIVVGAHMDSVSNPGADDNASGSTAVLEAATVLQQLKGRKVNIIFAWFDEEELGLIGSRYLARDFKKQGLKITSMHNIDMLGYDGDKDKTVEVAQPAGILWDYYNMVNKSHGLNLPLDRTNTGQSDHESFLREGYHAVCLSEEYTSGDTTPQYHRRGDVFETIDFDYLASSTRLVVAVVGDLTLKVPPPAQIQRIPNSQFPARQRHFHGSYEEAAAHL